MKAGTPRSVVGDRNAVGVRVQDVWVHNAYVSHGRRANRHKSYGYLRTPEMSELLRDFFA